MARRGGGTASPFAIFGVFAVVGAAGRDNLSLSRNVPPRTPAPVVTASAKRGRWGAEMAQPVLIVLHSETSTAGRIGHMLVEKGFVLDIRRPCLGEDLPATLENHAGAAIFGGPMSANDPDDWIAREIDWIGVVLKEEKPFLGVCLGAQMLSKHLGGEVGPHADGLVEIGYYPLRPTEQGQDLGPWPQHVYHWHREGLTLPSGAVRLATGDTFENQAFRCNGNAYGIQFHPEVTRLTMHRWGVIGAHRFALPNAQDAHAHLEGNLLHDAAVKRWLSQFLDHWLNPGG